MYEPDKWVLVKIDGIDPHYRVFGTWLGGYLNGDSWRMNSGVTSVEEEGDFYLFYGTSGSCYKCHKKSYGSSAFTSSVLASYVEDSNGMFKVIDQPNNILEMDWIL